MMPVPVPVLGGRCRGMRRVTCASSSHVLVVESKWDGRKRQAFGSKGQTGWVCLELIAAIQQSLRISTESRALSKRAIYPI